MASFHYSTKTKKDKNKNVSLMKEIIVITPQEKLEKLTSYEEFWVYDFHLIHKTP